MTDNTQDNDDLVDFIEEEFEDEIDDAQQGQVNEFSVNNSGGVMMFDGRRYATGLIWLTVDELEQPGSMMQRAKAVSADFICPRLFVSQTGYGCLNKNHRMGMASAAAIIADALVGEWHGVFTAENGWLYVAVHADIISPDGDVFFDSEEDAYNHFLSQAEKFKWPKTYVPESWNVQNNDGEIALAQLLEDASATVLKPVNLDGLFSGTANKNIAILCFVSFFAVVFLTFFSDDFFYYIFTSRQDASIERIDVANTIAVPPKIAEKKENQFLQAIETFKVPDPDKILDVCINSFSDLMVSLPGWNVSKMRCRDGFVEAIWNKGRGNLETVKPYLDRFPFGVNTTITSNGDFIASSIIKNYSNYGQKIELAKREDILITLNNRFTKVGRLEVRDVIPQNNQQNNVNFGARRFKGNGDEKNIMRREYTIEDLRSLEVIFSTESPPQNFVEYFDIPGLKMKTVEWDVQAGMWVYNFQIYLAVKDV